jgi:DNA-binding Xre family transcriptional regulator
MIPDLPAKDQQWTSRMRYHQAMSATVARVAEGTPLPSLRRIRLQKAFSQADLARAAGLAERTVAYADQGYAVTLRTTRKLAEVLGVTPDELRAEPDND